MKREVGASWIKRFMRGQLDRVIPKTPDVLLPALFRYAPQAMPALFKTPLTRAGGDIRNINNHDVESAEFYPSNGILCHFKFLGDFSARVSQELVRKEHYRKGAEYFRYGEMLRKHKRLDFRYPGTQKFESVAQLEQLGLITDMPVERPLNEVTDLLSSFRVKFKGKADKDIRYLQ